MCIVLRGVGRGVEEIFLFSGGGFGIRLRCIDK